MKNIKCLVLLVCMFPFALLSQGKNDRLKVLVVAHNPDSLLSEGYGIPVSPRFAELARTRGQEFRELLAPHFQTVQVVDSDTYHFTMSYGYDVTIMDDVPAPIEQIDLGRYRNGKSILRDGRPMLYNRYLPENFDRAVIMIGHITDDMTYGTTSKYTTQCHCLEAHAFNMDMDHAIFNSPYRVDLPLVDRPTPKPLAKYYSGANLPDLMKMWRVQTESMEDGNGYPIGQIMVGLGFDDSPDCEFISGGESIKDITGMSLGRSANVFHWGFSASPDFMTPSAKKVFINTVFYMAQFNGREPLIKMQRSNSRKWIDEFCFRKTGYLIDHKTGTYPKPESETDTLVKYYTENYNYFINSEGLTFKVDQDVKSLGIPNHDPQLLRKCIELMEMGTQKEKALRILKRYTEIKFDTAKEWKTWLDRYEKYLFFTELGGYKFVIDTWNHPELLTSSRGMAINNGGRPHPKTTEERDALTATAQLNHIEGNKYVLQIALLIGKGWHAYANLTPETSQFVPLKITIEAPEGCKMEGGMTMPDPIPYEASEGVEIYKDLNLFKQDITIDKPTHGIKDFKIKIDYQLCNDYTCKMPENIGLVLNFKE